MMYAVHARAIVPVGLALVSIIAGCARSQSARFYVLTTIAAAPEGEAVAPGRQDRTLAVGPIELPAYLDRPQIVTRSGQNRVELAEFDRWAEPIERRFARVLAEDLSVLLSTEQIVATPWKGTIPVERRVVADVIRFDGTLGGEVTLVVRWAILGPGQDEVVPMRRSNLVVPARAAGYEGLAAAMSQAIAALSREIAAVIRR